MTLSQAFEQLLNSKEFIEISKRRDPEGGKYRSYSSRYNLGKLKTGAITELLIAHGYKISANKTAKKIN